MGQGKSIYFSEGKDYGKLSKVMQNGDKKLKETLQEGGTPLAHILPEAKYNVLCLPSD